MAATQESKCAWVLNSRSRSVFSLASSPQVSSKETGGAATNDVDVGGSVNRSLTSVLYEISVLRSVKAKAAVLSCGRCWRSAQAGL